MFKKQIKRFLPDEKKIASSKWLKVFGKHLAYPGLWQYNRAAVATGSSIGLLVAFFPFPGHMVLAALLAILLRVNLPIAVILVWIVNPFTAVPLFGFAYALGALLLGTPESISATWSLQTIWKHFVIIQLTTFSKHMKKYQMSS